LEVHAKRAVSEHIETDLENSEILRRRKLRKVEKEDATTSFSG
jgi:hypothetical protein